MAKQKIASGQLDLFSVTPSPERESESGLGIGDEFVYRKITHLITMIYTRGGQVRIFNRHTGEEHSFGIEWVEETTGIKIKMMDGELDEGYKDQSLLPCLSSE